MYNKVLRHAGFDTVVTGYVEEAIAFYEELRPRIICLDWRLLDGTGKDFLDYLNSVEDELPAIFVISAEVTPDDIEGYQHLIRGYYNKPMELKEMVQKVIEADS